MFRKFTKKIRFPFAQRRVSHVINLRKSQQLSRVHVPNDTIRNFVLRIADVGVSSEIVILDDVDAKEILEVRVVEKEKWTYEDYLSASVRHTLLKNGEEWVAGNQTKYSQEEMENLLKGKMKGKSLFVIPLFSSWNGRVTLRLSDCAYTTFLLNTLATNYGLKVWSMMEDAEDVEFKIHCSDAQFSEPMEDKTGWEKIPLPSYETLQGKVELAKKELERRRMHEENSE